MVEINPDMDGGIWWFTIGDGTNQIYSNKSLEIRPGSGTGNPFSGFVFSPWVWNGTVYYELGASLPIPTLSEWGLIAMAGVLGLVGFVAIQRRKAAA